MANAGLIIYNNTGNLVIDSDYKNLCMRGKGSINTTTLVGSCSGVSFQISGLSATPLVVVSSTLGATAHVSAFAAGVATVEILCGGAVGSTVQYWVFDEPGVAVAPQYLAVYNAAGQCVFNAAEKYMRVVANYALPAVTGAGITLPSGRTYAAWLTNPCGRSVSFTSGGGGASQWNVTSIRRLPTINANVIDSVEKDVQQSGPYNQVGAPPRYQLDSIVFVLDVSFF